MKFIIMKITTENILTVLKIIAWITFIGFSIQCGAQIIAFILGFTHPELAKNMYSVDMNWFKLREESDWMYVCVMSVIIAISIFKANIWFMVIDLLTKLKLENPFTKEVAKKLESIAWQLFVVWLAGAIGSGVVKGIEKFQDTDFLYLNNEEEFLFVAGIVYIISQIFKRGIEIQEENELTV